MKYLFAKLIGIPKWIVLYLLEGLMLFFSFIFLYLNWLTSIMVVLAVVSAWFFGFFSWQVLLTVVFTPICYNSHTIREIILDKYEFVRDIRQTPMEDILWGIDDGAEGDDEEEFGVEVELDKDFEVVDDSGKDGEFSKDEAEELTSNEDRDVPNYWNHMANK